MDYDLIVIGGGPAGIAAAISGAKEGLSTAIIERHSMLGGNWTSGYVLSILGIYTYDGSTKIVGGIADEIIANLKDYDGTKGRRGNFVPFRPDEMKISLGAITKRYKIDVYVDSTLTGLQMEGKRIVRAGFVGKDGMSKMSAKFFVDASGDADAAQLCGKVMEGKEGEGWHQEATVPFRMGGIDQKGLIKFSKEHGDLVSATLAGGTLDRMRVMPALVEKAKKEHKIYLPHANSEFFFNTSREGEFVCNATHVNIKDFTSGIEIESALNDARHQIISSIDFLVRNVGGFENSYLIDSAPSIGMRETRRAVGEYVLKRADVLGNARFGDAIARCGHPVEIHDPKKGVIYRHLDGGDGSWYHIPYRAMVVKGVDNLFAVGRCLSAEFDAQASARVTGTAIAMGEAAGVAASMAIEGHLKAARIDVARLQDKLKRRGAII